MPALRLFSALVLDAFEMFKVFSSRILISFRPSTMECGNPHIVVTDLTVSFCPPADAMGACALDSQKWQRIEKELYLHAAQQSAWLHVAQSEEKEMTADDLVIDEIRIGELCPTSSSDESWEGRPGGIWILRRRYDGRRDYTVTAVDILFGKDAVDPRPQWSMVQPPLRLNAELDVPVAILTVQRATAKPRPDSSRAPLRVGKGGKFKIIQISDTHMVTGVGVCKDATDRNGQALPESEADPLTISFLSGLLDVEKPDLAILTGDQLHHDIPDSQSGLFKVVAPLIKRSIPYAAVFGNHDAEGTYALSRMAQMSLLEDLPFSLCQSGPEEVDGVGNYYLQIFGHAKPQLPLATLYLLDSHGQIPSEAKDPDYDWIKQSQIDWFTRTSQALRRMREKHGRNDDFHLSLAFTHIPLPEYGDRNLMIRGGQRREPTEGPSFNSHFYNALIKEGISAMGCGHDHVNDFCALRPDRLDGESRQDALKRPRLGPWLCYGGASGFGGYCSYGGKRYHRRSRVWELDTNTGSLKTWKRVEYVDERVDELVLVKSGEVALKPSEADGITVART